MATHALRLALLLLAGLTFVPVANGADAVITEAGVVVGSPSGRLQLDVAGTKQDLGPGLAVQLANAQPGDVVVAYASDTSVTAIQSIKRPVSAWYRLVALAIALLCLIGAAALATRGRPQQFMIGVDNRYSNSQTQLVLWFGAVAIVYAAAVALRIVVLGWGYVGGVDLPANLIALTGLSAFSFGGAKVLTISKVNAAAERGEPRVKLSAAAPRFVTDLFQTDSGQADLGDFQMILVTLAAATIFLLSAFHFLGALELAPSVTLPDIDATLLASFGIGQGAYLVKKAAGKPGEA